MRKPTLEYVQKLPKAELHLHLEGSVTPTQLMELSHKHGLELSGLDESEVLERVYEFSDFASFLDSFKMTCRHLVDPDDYQTIFDHLIEYFQSEGIRYAEIIYTPSVAWRFDRDGEAVLKRLIERAHLAEKEKRIKIRWILDCVRQFGLEQAWKTAELARAYRDEGVVAVGIGGDETSIDLEVYKAVFTWVKAHQLFVHVHAGEVGGPEQVWDAIKHLGANRIGHGIQSARDSRLMTYLREHAIALDICLWSNVRTGAWSFLSENPFGLLFKRGVPVTLNTDDPGLFHTTLTEEYLRAVEYFDLGVEDLHRLALQGVHSSFLPYVEKMELMQEFQNEIFAIEQ